MAFVVRIDFHWLLGKRAKVNNRSPASSRLSATARHLNRHLRTKAFRLASISRPIFHKLDETIRDHVSCSFLALVLKKELEDRIANIGKSAADGDAAQTAPGPIFSPISTR